jgi:hypothetical protein
MPSKAIKYKIFFSSGDNERILDLKIKDNQSGINDEIP